MFGKTLGKGQVDKHQLKIVKWYLKASRKTQT